MVSQSSLTFPSVFFIPFKRYLFLGIPELMHNSSRAHSSMEPSEPSSLRELIELCLEGTTFDFVTLLHGSSSSFSTFRTGDLQLGISERDVLRMFSFILLCSCSEWRNFLVYDGIGFVLSYVLIPPFLTMCLLFS